MRDVVFPGRLRHGTLAVMSAPSKSRWLDRLTLAVGIAAVDAAVGYAGWYYLRPESPDDA
jgi:hypothetical protein